MQRRSFIVARKAPGCALISEKMKAESVRAASWFLPDTRRPIHRRFDKADTASFGISQLKSERPAGNEHLHR